VDDLMVEAGAALMARQVVAVERQVEALEVGEQHAAAGQFHLEQHSAPSTREVSARAHSLSGRAAQLRAVAVVSRVVPGERRQAGMSQGIFFGYWIFTCLV